MRSLNYTMELSAMEQLINIGAIEFIRFDLADTHGLARSKTVHVSHLESYLNQGLNFPLPPLGQDVQGGRALNTGYLEELGFSDIKLIPDLKTLAVLPWYDKTARVLCDPYFLDDRPVMGAGRQVVKPLLDHLEHLGYTLLSGFEYEFCLVDKHTHQPFSNSVHNFASLGLKFDQPMIYQMLRWLREIGLDITTVNSENGIGQIEINYSPAWGKEAADQAFMFKNAVKEIALTKGVMASFMTKPQLGNFTNGCHYNQSLWREGKNAFFDPQAPDGISAICRHFVAGQLLHSRALCAIAAPTINCYKRFHSSAATPSQATWGINNRTVAIRLKAFNDQRTHIENRLPSGATNPYLLMAGCLAAGIDGIKRQLEPPTEAAPLPGRLEDALDALEQDDILQAMLPKELTKLYLGLKRHEIAKAKRAISDYSQPEFMNRVDDWEHQEFFEVL